MVDSGMVEKETATFWEAMTSLVMVVTIVCRRCASNTDAICT